MAEYSPRVNLFILDEMSYPQRILFIVNANVLCFLYALKTKHTICFSSFLCSTFILLLFKAMGCPRHCKTSSDHHNPVSTNNSWRKNNGKKKWAISLSKDNCCYNHWPLSKNLSGVLCLVFSLKINTFLVLKREVQLFSRTQGTHSVPPAHRPPSDFFLKKEKLKENLSKSSFNTWCVVSLLPKIC